MNFWVVLSKIRAATKNANIFASFLLFKKEKIKFMILRFEFYLEFHGENA